MSLAMHPLPADPAELRSFAVSLQAELARKDLELAANAAEIHAKTLHIEKLKMQLATLRRARVGRSSEKLDGEIEQLELLIGELEEDAAAQDARADDAAAKATPGSPAMPRQRRQPVRQPLPDHLPRETITHDPACSCPGCGGTTFSRIGQDEREVLEYVPSSFKVIRHLRPKLSCRACETIVQAPMPSLPIERGRPGPGLIAHVVVAKYCDHTPLPRQSVIYAREGVELDRATLAGWVGQAEFLLAPFAGAIGRHVRSGTVLHADDGSHRASAMGARHHRPGARTRQWKDQNRAALGRRARRAALGIGCAGGGVLPLFAGSQGHPCGDAARHLPGLPARRRLQRLRSALPAGQTRRRSTVDRGCLLEPCAPQNL